jgi:hypothetical protein
MAAITSTITDAPFHLRQSLAAALGISPSVIGVLVNLADLAADLTITPAHAEVLTSPAALAAAVGISPSAAEALVNARALAAALGVTPAVALALTKPSTPVIYGSDLFQWHAGSDVTLNVSAVSSWTDLSGKGNHSIQATGAAQPAYAATDATLNNQPTVTGDGSNDVLTCATLTCNLTTDDFYICFILKQNAWTSGRRISSGTGGTVPRLAQGGTTPTLQANAASGANDNTGAPIGTWVRGEVLWSTAAGASYTKFGSTVVQTGNPGTGSRTSSSLFADPAAVYWSGAIAECFVVKRAAGTGGPTPVERAAVDAYLQAKYPSAAF